MALYTAGARGIQLAANLILAGILFPKDFGAFALGAVLVNGLIMFREMGFTPALIQIKDEVDRAFNAAVVAVPVFGILVYSLIYAIAPLFARSLGDESLIPIVRVLGLAAPLTSFGVTPSVYLQRNMLFKRKALPEFGSIAMGSLASIGMALAGLGVWSLVLGLVMTEALKSGLYWSVVRYRFKPRIDFPMWRRLLKYGVQVSVGSSLAFFYTLIDQYSVGRYFGTVNTGFYSFAFRPCMQISNNVVILSNQVALPTLASLQDEREGFFKAYLKILTLFTLLATPISAFVFIFGDDLLRAFYGSKWDGSILALRIFAFYGWSRAVGAINTEVFFAKARPRYFTFQMGGQLLAVLAILPLALNYGAMEAVAAVFTGVLMGGMVVTFILAARLMQTSLLHPLKVIASHIIPLLAGWLAEYGGGLAKIGLIGRILLFFAGYTLILILTNRKQVKSALEIFTGFIKNRGGDDE